jgi:hypothetical protein
MEFWPYLVGLAFVVVLFLALWVVLKDKVSSIIVGEDGRMSSSKFQVFLWTIVIIFAYGAVFAKNPYDVLTDIPANVLTVLGISLITGIAAKGITTSYIEKGRITKKKQERKYATFQELFNTDDGRPDLAKIQMLAWTFIAVLVYLVRLYGQIGCLPGTTCYASMINATALAAGTAAASQTALPVLPDIDTALMVLMGLGSGTYLGDKLTASSKPRITGLSTGNGKPGDSLTISGEFFGDTQWGSLITFDGTPLKVKIDPKNWKNSLITLTIPADIFGSRIAPEEGQRVQVGVTVGGVDSNTVPFMFLKS